MYGLLTDNSWKKNTNIDHDIVGIFGVQRNRSFLLLHIVKFKLVEVKTDELLTFE